MSMGARRPYALRSAVPVTGYAVPRGIMLACPKDSMAEVRTRLAICILFSVRFLKVYVVVDMYVCRVGVWF